MMTLPTSHIAHRPALRCVSGPLRGERWSLDVLPARIGRSEGVELTLPEDQVSRTHARIERAPDDDSALIVTDLHSTNGTYINGCRLAPGVPQRLSTGDRMLIGVSIFAFERTVEPVIERSGVMAGRIEAVGLASILQLLGGGQRTALLHLETPYGEGLITFEEGRITGAQVDSVSRPVTGEKAFYRMMTWDNGLFVVLEDRPPEGFDRSLDPSDPMSLLLEGARVQDELAAHAAQLGVHIPEPSATLAIPTVITPPLRELHPEALDTLQLAHNHGTVSALLDASLDHDADTLRDLLDLLARGYLTLL